MGCHSAANELILNHSSHYEPSPHICTSRHGNFGASFLRIKPYAREQEPVRTWTFAHPDAGHRDADGNTGSRDRADSDASA
jgi:hypothetical protein